MDIQWNGEIRLPPDNNEQQQQPASLHSWLLSRCQRLCSQLTLSEISGSVGDLGTFIPLAVALARQEAIYLGPALFLAGMANVISGILFDIPICVQPMKSIAAVAIAEGLSRQQVTTAGIWMGLFLILLSITNGIELVNWLVPTPVVCGIQMGVGINLAIRGLLMIQSLQWWDQPDCIVLAVVAAILCLYLLREKRIQGDDDDNDNNNEEEASDEREQSATPAPVGLYLFGLGVCMGIFHLITTNANAADDNNQTKVEWFGGSVVTWALQHTTWQDWKEGLLEGAIPQLPLTTLNSVVSVCCLAHTLYPEKRRPTAYGAEAATSDAVVSRKEVSWSVGMMNLVLCPLGAMPCCHGAGGLAGQHKFGARHGASVVFLGINKMILASVLGKSLLMVLDALPLSILGLMLVVCGHELAMMGLIVLVQSSTAVTGSEHHQQMTLRQNSVVTLITVIVNVGLHKTHYAALTGWVTFLIYGDGLKNYWTQWRGQYPIHGGVEYSPVTQMEEPDDGGNT